MQRGIEGSRIFADDIDKWCFLDRAHECFSGKGPRCLSWSLMTNHDHLETITREQKLSDPMHALGTGYATYFNKRHDRQGHLYQNRYKSLLIEEEDYMFRVLRYVMLNPIRAGMLRDLRDLETYPFTSYAALMGNIRPRVVDVDFTLQLFDERPDRARCLMEEWMLLGLEQDDPIGEILERGPGRPSKETAIKELVSRIAIRDSFVVGNKPFVACVLTEARHPAATRLGSNPHELTIDDLIDLVCAQLHVDPAAITEGRRHREVSRARAAIAWLGVEAIGLTQTDLALRLGVSQQALSRALPRGREAAERLVLEHPPER